MSGPVLWQFGGGPESLIYRFFDVLRRDLNVRLVRFLTLRALHGDGGIVVEAGSGPGSGSSVFRAQTSARLSVAVDYDPAALHEARRRDPGLAAVVADIRRLPFRSGCCDLVWSSSTLEHLPDRDVAMREMARIAKPGGHAFVGVPYKYGPLGFQRWIAATRVGDWIGPVFAPGELIAILRSLGLRPRATYIYFFAFFVGVLADKPSNGAQADRSS